MKHLYLVGFFFICAIGLSQEGPKSNGIENLSMYPNPVTQGKVFISTADNAPKKIFIFNVLGTQVLETTILGKELNLSNLDAGVYVLRIMERDKVATRKLIIK